MTAILNAPRHENQSSTFGAELRQSPCVWSERSSTRLRRSRCTKSDLLGQFGGFSCLPRLGDCP